MIATIEDRDRSFDLEKGPAYSPAREVDAIRLHTGLLTDDSVPDYSARMPRSVRNDLKTKLDAATASVHQQWSSFAEETDMTAHLKAELQKVEVELDGLRLCLISPSVDRFMRQV